MDDGVIWSHILRVTRRIVISVMASTSTSLDHFCDKVVNCNFVFIIERSVKEIREGLTISSIGNEETIFQNYMWKAVRHARCNLKKC